MKVLTLTDETGKVLYKTTVDNWRVDQVLDGEQLRITITGWTKEVAKRKATPAEEAQRTRDEERKSSPPWTTLGPSYPTLPLKPEHRVSYSTPHKTCVCDIKDLMSTGHRSGCPEKRLRGC